MDNYLNTLVRYPKDLGYLSKYIGVHSFGMSNDWSVEASPKKETRERGREGERGGFLNHEQGQHHRQGLGLMYPFEDLFHITKTAISVGHEISPIVTDDM